MSFRVFLANTQAIDSASLKRVRSRMREWEHERARIQDDADATFIWIPTRIRKVDPELAFYLSASLNLGQFTLVGSPHLGVLEKVNNFLRKCARHAENGKFDIDQLKFALADSPKEAYENSMADVDIVLKNKKPRLQRFVRCHGNSCQGCKGKIAVCSSALIYGRGVAKKYWHPHCHELQHNPGQASAAIFNAELVSALSSINADLEQRLSEYQGRFANLASPVDAPGL